MSTSLEAMRLAVIDHPDDVAAHLVYADALTEQGDELGPLISAMCKQAHVQVEPSLRKRLVGSLGEAVDVPLFEKGVLRGVLLHDVDRAELVRLTGCPEWRGVTSVTFAERSPAHPSTQFAREVVGLVTHPVCRSLREVRDLSFGSFTALCEQSLTLDLVSVADALFWSREVRVTVVPTLRVKTLEVRPLHNSQLYPWFEWFQGGGRALFDTLEELRMAVDWSEGIEVLAMAPRRLQRLSSSGLEATREGERWRVVLELSSYDVVVPEGDEPTLVEAVLGECASALSSVEIHTTELSPAAQARYARAAPGVSVSFVWTRVGEIGPSARRLERLPYEFERPGGTTSEAMLGLEELVAAAFLQAEHEIGVPEWMEYYRTRLRVLAQLLGCDFLALLHHDVPQGPSSPERRDRAAVEQVALDCLSAYVAAWGPFRRSFTEQQGPLETGVFARSMEPSVRALREFKDSLRRMFADCLLTLYPELEHRQVPAVALYAAGVPRRAPWVGPGSAVPPLTPGSADPVAELL